MTTVESRLKGSPVNVEKKERKPRTAKPVSAKGVGIKIAELLEKLPEDQRAKALSISAALTTQEYACLP